MKVREKVFRAVRGWKVRVRFAALKMWLRVTDFVQRVAQYVRVGM